MRKLSIDELAEFDTSTRFDHPNFVFRQIVELIRKIGVRNFLHAPKHDHDRDMLVACMFTYGVRMLEEREWFLRRGDNPPDFEMIAATEKEITEKPIHFAQVEIVQIPEIFKTVNDALQMIRDKKLSNYSIGNDNILLIFINHSSGPSWIEELCKRLDLKGSTFSQAWAIFILNANREDSFIYCIKNLIPGGDTLTLSLKKEFMKGLLYPNKYLEKFGAKIIEK